MTEPAAGLAATAAAAARRAPARASRAPAFIAAAAAVLALSGHRRGDHRAVARRRRGPAGGPRPRRGRPGGRTRARRERVASACCCRRAASPAGSTAPGRAAVALTAAATALFVLRDVDVPAAFVAAVLLLALWHWRAEFFAAAIARPAVRAILAAGLALAIVLGYGVAAQIWRATSAGLAWSWAEVVSQAAWGMVGQDIAVPSTDLSREVVAAQTVGSVLILAALAWTLLRPPRGGATSSDREWQAAKRLVSTYGNDSLAYFALRRDKRYFFGEGHSAFLAYRAVGGIALVSGDPIGEAAHLPALLAEFAAYCRRQAWRVAVIGVGAEMRSRWEELGLKTLYVGDEAIARPSRFSLEGRAVRKLRQSVNRLERLGYRVEMRRADELDSATQAAVVKVSEIWRGGQPERGFSMALEDVRSTELDDTLFVLGRGPDDELGGFLHFVPVPATGDLSLSAMRRLPDTPNGFNEFLVSSLLAWARERGIERVSLNFSVFGSLLRDESSGPAMRLTRGALHLTDRFFQVESLLNFNRKFEPDWVPRYLAVESRADVPAVGLVVLRLENLLPRVLGADKAAADPRPPGADSPGQGSAGTPPGEPLQSEAVAD